MEHKLSFFSSSSPLCLLFLLFVFQCTASVTTVNRSDLIDEVCRTGAEKSADLNYAFCVVSLQANPNAKRSDVRELGIITLRLAIANATHTVERIERMLGSEDFDKHSKRCLEDCLELYRSAIPRLDEVVKEIKGKNYKNTNIWISSAMDAATTCEEGFVEGAAASLLPRENYCMFQLCDMALVITSTFS